VTVRVGVDATSWANRRGFGRFARNAVGRLLSIDRETTYVFFVDGSAVDGPELPPGGVRRVVPLRRPSPEGPAAGGRRPVGDLLRLTRAASGRDLDAFLFPSVYSYYPVFRVPTVVGLHDTTAAAHPDLLFATRRERMLWRAKEQLAVRLATRVFTVSQASRRALAETLGVDAEAIPVVAEAPDPAFAPRSADDAARVAQAIGVPPEAPFVVYAAGISPHKNIETLLEAFAMLERPAWLVLAGDLEGPYLSATVAVRAQIAELGLEERALLPGFVSDDDLACLYSGAIAAVVPSLSEGFGLPAVEAAACGAAALLSDLPPHRETLADAALFFQPTDAPALRDALDRLLSDRALRRSVGERCRKAVAHLSWDAAAEQLRGLIAEAAVRGGRRNG